EMWWCRTAWKGRGARSVGPGSWRSSPANARCACIRCTRTTSTRWGGRTARRFVPVSWSKGGGNDSCQAWEVEVSGIVFVGCKTTGLDPDRHEIRQLALIVDHEAHAWTIGAGGDPWRYAAEAWYLTSNRTLVGVDPAFDVAFLTKFLRRRGY